MLEGVLDGGGRGKDLVEALLDRLRHLERMEDGALNADADMAQPARRVRIGEQVVREHRVQVEDGVAVESDLLRLAHKELDGVLVIEDHLRFDLVFSFGVLAEVDKALGVDQRVGVAFQAA